MACTNQRGATGWRPHDHPNVGVEGDWVENVRLRSILTVLPDGHRLLATDKFPKNRFDEARTYRYVNDPARRGTPLIRSRFLYIWGLQIGLNFVPA
jgi:hypothetical protein